MYSRNQYKDIFLILFILFLITEIIDDILDYLLGSSVVHSIIQFFVFVVLFFMVSRLFLMYYKKGVSKLIPDELMQILHTIKSENAKGVLVNQVKLTKLLNVTKPTMKKRIDQLAELKYIDFEEKGNSKYIRLTDLGNSILK